MRVRGKERKKEKKRKREKSEQLIGSVGQDNDLCKAAGSSVLPRKPSQAFYQAGPISRCFPIFKNTKQEKYEPCFVQLEYGSLFA